VLFEVTVLRAGVVAASNIPHAAGAVYDGVKFTTFDTGNTPALQSNVIFALYEDRQGALWVGTAGGLSRFKWGGAASGSSPPSARTGSDGRPASRWPAYRHDIASSKALRFSPAASDSFLQHTGLTLPLQATG
jgi:hypothetical protein